MRFLRVIYDFSNTVCVSYAEYLMYSNSNSCIIITAIIIPIIKVAIQHLLDLAELTKILREMLIMNKVHHSLIGI